MARELLQVLSIVVQQVNPPTVAKAWRVRAVSRRNLFNSHAERGLNVGNLFRCTGEADQCRIKELDVIRQNPGRVPFRVDADEQGLHKIRLVPEQAHGCADCCERDGAHIGALGKTEENQLMMAPESQRSGTAAGAADEFGQRPPAIFHSFPEAPGLCMGHGSGGQFLMSQ